jgi:hypothetical protein
MGMFSKHEDDAPEYVSEGHQPGEGRLLPDERVTAAIGRHERSQTLAADKEADRPAVTTPTGPVVQTIHVGNRGWRPETKIVPVGEVSEIVGREPYRDTFDVTNQTSAITADLTGTAVPCNVWLFENRDQAERFKNSGLTLAEFRGCALPDGAGRTLTHTAPMFAVAVAPSGSAATYAIIDLSIETSPKEIKAS